MNCKPLSKLIAMVLTVAMILSGTPLTVSAEAAGCTHEHDESCGYVAGAPCAHEQGEHDDACGYRSAAPCGHVHDEACGEDEADCGHVHDGDCGYAEAAPCAHEEHDDACGYIEAVSCNHVHDEDCGGLSLGDSGNPTATPTDVVTVAVFDELDEYTLWQGYDYGEITSQDELDLPDTLTGTDTDGEAVTIAGVTWRSEPAFDPLASLDPAEYLNGYIFSPALPEGYALAEGVTAPKISVVIRPEGGAQIRPLATWEVTRDDDHVSSPEPGMLRYAINNAGDGDEIVIAASLGGQTITLSKEITIDKDLTIIGMGQSAPTIEAVNGSRHFRISHVTPSTVTIQNLTLDGGAGGGGIYNFGGALTLNNVTIQNCADSGVTNFDAALTIKSVTIQNCGASGSQGGGIRNVGGTADIQTGCKITDNIADEGGGIYNDDDGTVDINADCVITGNTAFVVGGGIINVAVYGGSTVNLYGTVSGNTAPYGGGIYNDGAISSVNTVNIKSGGTVNGNIENWGTADVSGTVTGNISNNSGGIFNILSGGAVNGDIENWGTVNIRSGGTVAGNIRNYDYGTLHVESGGHYGVPGPPQTPTATPGDKRVTIRWDAPLDSGGSAITGYQVSKDNGSTWTNAGLVTSYTFTGLTNGTAYIFKVRAVNSVGGGAAATVTATPDAGTANVSVTGVALDKSALTLVAGGDTGTLTATVQPANASNRNVTWQSSDLSVATVSGGVVTGMSEGTANVTVTTDDGGKTATCTVRVLPAGTVIVPVTGVSVSPKTASLTVGNTRQLTATVIPVDATIRDITWSSSNPAVAAVDGSGKVTALAAGTATITATNEESGLSDTCAVTVTSGGGYIPGGTTSDSGSSSSGSGGGGSGSAGTTALATTWLDASGVNNLAKDAKDKKQDYARTKSTGAYGVRAAALKALAGLRFEHDTVADGAVQLRLYIDNPEKITKDVMVSGYVKGSDVEWTSGHFEKYFKNTLRVIHMDQQADWGQPVKLAARIDLTGMDTKKLYFYAYDKKTNTYRRIEKPAYWIDKNGYLRFTTELAGDIIISEGPLVKK